MFSEQIRVWIFERREHKDFGSDARQLMGKGSKKQHECTS
jgi:hypothetical protein